MSVFDKIGDVIEGHAAGEHETSPFYHFEPWDVQKRPEWMMEQARLDGIDITSPEFIRHTGTDPHPFQSGYLHSTSYLRCLLAGTSVGKSYVAFMEGLIMITGELPISLRYDKDVDTGVKRMLNDDNIRRWGRREVDSGKIIDYNTTAKKDGLWDCGTIIGVGKYPNEKIAEPGSEIWIGTMMKPMMEYWWPRLHDPKNRIIPEHMIDKTRGHNGFNVQDRIVYLSRGGKLAVITYETGYNRFEAQRVHAVILDEEPEDERIFQAAQQRSGWLSMVETPYRGLTYTKRIMFPDETSPDKTVFHATQYDSPYQSRDMIDKRRQSMNPWDIGARIWGLHSEVRGMPYYDRMKIGAWLGRYSFQSKHVEFKPNDIYHGMVDGDVMGRETIGLMSVSVSSEKREQANGQSIWKIYEDVQPGVPYVMAVDPAEGAENPDDAADVCAAMIARPDPDIEGGIKIVASLRSGLETLSFARVCSHACRYYNNALLAAETRRAACNATFASELRDYPFWYKMTTIQQSTRKARQLNGFDTNAATRGSMFELIQGWLANYTKEDYPDIPDRALLKELAACVCGKGGRPDHTTDGTLDTTICFGILLYVFKNSPEQIFCNADEEAEDKRPFGRIMDLMERDGVQELEDVGYLGSTMPNWR